MMSCVVFGCDGPMEYLFSMGGGMYTMLMMFQSKTELFSYGKSQREKWETTFVFDFLQKWTESQESLGIKDCTHHILWLLLLCHVAKGKFLASCMEN